MFETLDAINWASLEGCYHSAANMPELLRSFRSPVPEIRDWAMEEIGNAIFHQGTVFTVTPVVIPFLFELLEDEDVQDKEEVVCLLTALASCGVFEETNEEQRRRLDADLSQKLGITYEESLQRLRELVRTVKAAIAGRFDLLYPYLRYRNDFYVRLSVATALCEFPDIAKRLRPNLESALQSDPDEYVRTAIAAALTAAGETTPKGASPANDP